MGGIVTQLHIPQLYGIKLMIDRDGKFTEELWANYGSIGHGENWSNTENVRQGIVEGDYVIIYGKSTNSNYVHIIYCRVTNNTGTIHGTTMGHVLIPYGNKT